jgi:hypothetical protein
LELVAAGRLEVRGYGGEIVEGTVTSAKAINADLTAEDTARAVAAAR